MPQGYDGLPNYYLQSSNPITPNLGLSLKGMDPVVAEDFVLIDTAIGGGLSIEVNGSVVASPNFNDTTPAAPAGHTNVIWQVSGSNVSAYITTPATSWSTLTGTLSNGQVVPYADAGISRLAASSLAIGNGTNGDFSGALKLTTLNAVTGYQVNGGATSGHVLRGNGTNFVDAQLGYGDLSGTPQLPNTTSRTAHSFFTTYSAVTGNFGQAQPAVADLSDTPSANQVLAGPTSGSAATATFRALVLADLPTGIPVTLAVHQVSHGFTVGQALYYTGSAWALAKSNAATTLGIGLVSTVVGADDFVITFSGYITGMSGLSAGNYYFVSDSSAGALTTTEPVASGSFSNPIFFATSTTTGVVEPYRPSVVATSITLPQSMAKVAHKWLDSYDASTGLFTQSQPAAADLSDSPISGNVLRGNGSAFVSAQLAYTDLSGTPQLAQTKAAVTSNFFTSYTASTGLFTAAQPAFTDISGSIALAQTPLTTLGDLLYVNVTPALTRLAGNTTTTKMYLSQTGTSVVSAAPAWAQINYADITGTTPTPPSGAVLWSALGNAGANLTLANAGNTSTFNQTSAVAWLWANTTPTVTGASTTVALSTTTPPSNVAGNTWRYTLNVSESGAGSNGWVGAAVTISGYTGGATGNNGTSLPITASTTTTVDITNATGTTTNTGTPVMISTAGSSSPLIEVAGTCNTGTAGTLNSAADIWSIQVTNNMLSNGNAGIVPNPITKLVLAHVSGSSGVAWVDIPSGNLSFGASSTVNINSTNNGTLYAFGYQGTNYAKIQPTTTEAVFGAVAQAIPVYLSTNYVNQNGGDVVAIGNTTNPAPSSGTWIGLNIGGAQNAGTGQQKLLNWAPTSGSGAFIGCLIKPTINNTGSSGAYTTLKIAPIETALNGVSTNRLIDCYAGSSGTTQVFALSNAGKITNYNAIATVGQGVCPQYALANLTTQAANVAATTIYAVPASGAGLYRVTVYLVVSQAATTSSTLPDSRIIFTDQDSGATITVPLTAPYTTNTTSTFAQNTFIINAKASTNIQYDIGQATAYASVGGTPMQFAYRARLQAL